MKTMKILVLAAIAMMFGAILACAQAPGGNNPPSEGQGNEMPMEKKQGPMMAMNMMGFMPKQMVATTDGAVIILAGNKLLKYDKDLNLVKEVEITGVAEMKIDAGAMQDMIGKMKEKYGKHKDKSEPESQPAPEAK